MVTALRTKTTGLILDGAAVIGGVAPANLRDKSRWGNDGVFTNITMVQLPSGLWVMSCNGLNSEINCGNDPSFNITIAITVEFWTKPTGGYNPGDGTVNPFSKNGIYEFYLLNANGKLGFYLNGGATTVFSTITSWNDRWYFIVATFDRDAGANNLILYIDGAFNNSSTYAPPLNVNAQNVTLGRRSGAAGWYDGQFAPLCRVYNYALTPGQILKRYEATRRWFGV